MTSLFCVVSVLVESVAIGDLTVLCCQCSGCLLLLVTSLFCVVNVLVESVAIGDLTVLCCQWSG